MMTLKVPAPAATSEPVMQPADRLTVGDQIAAEFLPEREPVEVGFVQHFRIGEEPWVFIAYLLPGGKPGSTEFRAEAKIPLAAVADFTGLTYTRADSDEDDPTPVSPARVPLHTGSVGDDGLVVDGGES